jgi:hypothetical protein
MSRKPSRIKLSPGSGAEPHDYFSYLCDSISSSINILSFTKGEGAREGYRPTLMVPLL